MSRTSTMFVGLAFTLLLGCDSAPLPGEPPPVVQQPLAGDLESRAGHKAFRGKDYSAAIVHFQRALELPRQSSTKSDILTSIGNCHDRMDQFEDALRYHELAIAEDPKNYRAYVNAGVVCRLQGKYDKAKEMYHQALAIEPNYAELHASLGALCTVEGEFEQAVGHLERAVKLDKSLPIAHANLSLAYASVGRFAEADAELKQAIVLGYENSEVIQKRIDRLKQAAEKK